MKLKLALSTATALGLLMGGVAYANNENTLYLEQDGKDNVASVHQSSGGGKNDIGTLADPVTQDGDRNEFRYSNSGSGSGTNNDIIKAEQFGDDNYMSVSNWNNSINNVYNRIIQDGDKNQARITANGSDNGLVDDVLQDGTSNHLVIEQSGSSSTGNKVHFVRQIGDNNGLVPDGNGSTKRAGTYIYQAGNYNEVAESSITGSNNIGPAGTSATYRNVHQIKQSGNYNGTTASTAKTLGSGVGAFYNRIWVDQSGNYNNFHFEQGVDASSTGNHINAIQFGNYNMAEGRQDGSYNTITSNQSGNNNVLDVLQVSDGNTVTATVSGNNNGGGTLAGVAGTLAGTTGSAIYPSLTSGQVIQHGLNNTATLTVTNSNGNQFAFLQQGNANTIDGKVSGAGSNSATAVQIGSTNMTSFNQSGSGNQISASQ